MAKSNRPKVTGEFHAMGTIRSDNPELDGKRIDIEASVEVSPDFFDTLEKIFTTDESNLFELSKIIKADPKTFYAYADMTGMEIFDGRDEWHNADLRGVNFTNTKWKNTSLWRAVVFGSNFTGAEGLTEDDFAVAYIDAKTILPEGIDRNRVLEKHKALNFPRAPIGIVEKPKKIRLPATVTNTDTTPPKPRLS
ncbi:MAG TPA: pentapeptide repeat-containing protein [Alphaproteobacteria bacterium]